MSIPPNRSLAHPIFGFDSVSALKRSVNPVGIPPKGTFFHSPQTMKGSGLTEASLKGDDICPSNADSGLDRVDGKFSGRQQGEIVPDVSGAFRRLTTEGGT